MQGLEHREKQPFKSLGKQEHSSSRIQAKSRKQTLGSYEMSQNFSDYMVRLEWLDD
jgi:hypothetical protein